MKGIRICRILSLALLIMISASAATLAHAQYSVLYYFAPGVGTPVGPVGVVAQGRDGNLYGTTNRGGASDSGTVFKITPAGKLTVLYSFCSQANCADGKAPIGGLTLRPDGHFIGTTSGAGQYPGTIFDISPGGSLNTLHTFTNTDGGFPRAAPIQGADGQFYGVTGTGGAPSGCGTVYRLSAVFTVLHRFNQIQGCLPWAPLVLGTDGSLYGTTVAGGMVDAGVFYKVTYRPGKATLFTVLDDLDGVTLSGPQAPLIEGSDGDFYGTAAGGLGAPYSGVIFKMTPSGNLTVLHDLNGTTDGGGPMSGLLQGTDGSFYGNSGSGGSTSGNCAGGGCGTLFQVTPAGSFSTLYTYDYFSGTGGVIPFQHTNGLLYGNGGGGIGAGTSNGVFYSWNGSLPAFVSFVPDRGKVGSFVEILGQGFTSSTTVSFNGTPATATVVLGTYLRAFVPSGATTGFITVTTSSGTLTSNKKFLVMP